MRRKITLNRQNPYLHALIPAAANLDRADAWVPHVPVLHVASLTSVVR